MSKTDYKYHSQVDTENLRMIEDILKGLPCSVADYIHAKAVSASTRTQLAYVRDIRRFFLWFAKAVPGITVESLKNLSCDVISKITSRDIEEYVRAIALDPVHRNGKVAVSRKLSALNSYFKYLQLYDEIQINPCEHIERPPSPKAKPIVYLTQEEAARFLDVVYHGASTMSDRQNSYLDNTRTRDFAIILLLLNTGIRRSECVGLNLEDYNRAERYIQIYRKGGKYQRIALNEEAFDALDSYFASRIRMDDIPVQDSHALFISLQKRRLQPASINAIIRKYALAAGIQKQITPHVFRKTFGTTLYKNCRDIYLVAGALGHSSVATTTQHYVTDSEDALRDQLERLSFLNIQGQ